MTTSLPRRDALRRARPAARRTRAPSPRALPPARSGQARRRRRARSRPSSTTRRRPSRRHSRALDVGTGAPSKHVRRGSRIEPRRSVPAPCDVSALTRDGRGHRGGEAQRGYIDPHAGIGKTGHGCWLQSHQRVARRVRRTGRRGDVCRRGRRVRAVIPWEEADAPGRRVHGGPRVGAGSHRASPLRWHRVPSDASGRPDGAVARGAGWSVTALASVLGALAAPDVRRRGSSIRPERWEVATISPRHCTGRPRRTGSPPRRGSWCARCPTDQPRPTRARWTRRSRCETA